VCLLDLDLHLGDVLSFMDVAGNYSITDVLANMARLDRDLLSTSMTKHASGVNVLAQSGEMGEAEHIKGHHVTHLLNCLRRTTTRSSSTACAGSTRSRSPRSTPASTC